MRGLLVLFFLLLSQVLMAKTNWVTITTYVTVIRTNTFYITNQITIEFSNVIDVFRTNTFYETNITFITDITQLKYEETNNSWMIIAGGGYSFIDGFLVEAGVGYKLFSIFDYPVYLGLNGYGGSKAGIFLFVSTLLKQK